jgi:hypothetical protein
MGQARADLAAAVAVLRQLGATGQLQARPQDRDAARVYLAVASLAVALLAVEDAAVGLPLARAAARVVGAAVRVAWAAGRWAGRGS